MSASFLDSHEVKKLGDFLSLQRGTTYKSSLLGQPGAFLIGLASIEREGGFRSNKLETYGGDSPQKISLKPGDLYVSLKDITHDGHLLGAVARLPDYVEHGRLTQDTVKLVFETEPFPKTYVYWLLRTPQYRDYCRSRQTGTTNLGLSREDFLSFPVPPLTDIRSSIVTVLEAIERKIENLRRQNETLEAIAQTLFKHWFIDFEFPNEDGKPYKSSGGEMVRSELGEIPVGWKSGKLSELIIVNPKETIKQGSFVKYVDMKSLSTSSMQITDFITREFTSGSKFRNGDTLLARITPCLENGKTAFVNILEEDEVAYGSTEFIVMRAEKNCCPEYVYCLSRSSNFRDYAIKNMTGSSGRQRVPNDQVEDYELAIPRVMQVQLFHSTCEPLFIKIKTNKRQIQTLTKTRDRLLPELMSGKLRIRETAP